MTVLVAGGSGRLGVALVDGLLDAGVRVRVLTRSSATAEALRRRGVDVVVGSADDPIAVRAAVDGCTTVISAISGFSGAGGASPRSVDQDGNRRLIRSAVQVGVRRFVLVSTHGAAEGARLELDRRKAAAERMLRDTALDWTIVRPAPFLETQLDAMAAPLAASGRTLILGSGVEVVRLVPVEEVAAVVLRAALTGSPGERTIEVLGIPCTRQALSDALHARAGTDGRTRRIPLPALRVLAVVARPFHPFLARAAASVVEMHRASMQERLGPLDRAESAAVAAAVATAVGAPAGHPGPGRMPETDPAAPSQGSRRRSSPG